MKKSLLCILMTLIVACSYQSENRGYQFSEYESILLIDGISDKQDVLDIMGVPSAKTPVTLKNNDKWNEKWFYISNKIQHGKYLKFNADNLRIISIEFNDDGIIKKISDNKNNPRKISLTQRKTKNFDRDMTIIEQIIRNQGKLGGLSRDADL